MMMEEEMQKKATIKLYEDRQGVIQSAMTSTLENDKAVEEVLSSKGKQQTELISKMLEDEKYQREAFQALLLQQDHRALEISDQMAMIQNELAALTIVEMKKRDMKVIMVKLNLFGNWLYTFIMERSATSLKGIHIIFTLMIKLHGLFFIYKFS